MKILAIQSHGEDVGLPPVALIGAEVHHTLGFIHAVDAFHLPIAVRQLRHEFGVAGERVLLVELIEVNVIVAVAPAGPEEAVTGCQQLKIDFGMHVDPGIAGFGHHKF